MVDWNDPQIKLIIYLIYGTSFILMSLFITIRIKKVATIEFMKDFRYLAIFGLLHGLGEYSSIPETLLFGPTWLFDIVKLILISTSFAILCLFGLSIITIDAEDNTLWIRGIPIGALLMYFWLLIAFGIDFKNRANGISSGISYQLAEQAIRYSLGFLGAAITSFSFIYLSGKIKDVAGEYVGEILFIGGLCFGLYAIFGGLILDSFIGIPIMVFRTIIALLITMSVVEIFQWFRDPLQNKS